MVAELVLRLVREVAEHCAPARLGERQAEVVLPLVLDAQQNAGGLRVARLARLKLGAVDAVEGDARLRQQHDLLLPARRHRRRGGHAIELQITELFLGDVVPQA